MLRRKIETLKLDLIVIDPFVKSHALEENDNAAMDFVAELLTRLAIEYDIAVDASHHARKGILTPGDADAGRGGSALKDAGRLIYTLTAMTQIEAEMFGIDPMDRRSYVRLDSAKVNLMPGTTPAAWFRLVGVKLDNGNALYPNGDEIQTVEPWQPPELWTDVATATLNLILTDIDKGLPNGQRFSGANAAKARAAWSVVQRHCPHKSDAQCRKMIATWRQTGVLYDEEYDDPVRHEKILGLRVDPTKRPGREIAETR